MKTPGQASQDGQTLLIRHPIGGDRIAAHVFDLEGGGIAFLDSGWTEPLVAHHTAHLVEGRVTAFLYGDALQWEIESPDGDVYLELNPEQPPLEGTREAAREAVLGQIPADLA